MDVFDGDRALDEQREHQLARALQMFPGRAGELRLLHCALFPRPRPLTVWVWGGPGTGKTAVVDHLLTMRREVGQLAT